MKTWQEGLGKYGNIAQKNLAVLKYLSDLGNWSNPKKIRLGAGGNANLS